MDAKHPVWDGTPTLDMADPLNQEAQQLMWHFYLGQGFMEPPEWDEIGDDFRFGFRAIASFVRKKAVD